MKLKISYLLLILNNLSLISMEMIFEDNCDAEDSSLAEWYSRIYNFVQVNQNTSQHILQLNDKLQNLELKAQQINQNLDQCLKEQQHQKTQNINNVAKLEDKINRLEQQVKEVHEKRNGNIVIQRRQDGSVDFYRDWDEYKKGFGNVSGEFFIGLDKLHKITNTRPYELLVVVEDWENDRRYAKYDQFIVGSENESYKLTSLGAYSGSAGDSFSTQLGQKFSTKDKDNDGWGSSCAVTYSGAWWYGACHESNLNGRYLKGSHTEYAVSVIWYKFKGHHYSLKFAEMTLIPK